MNVLVTGQALIREGLLAVLAEDEDIVAQGIGNDPEQLLENIRSSQPDIILFSVTSFAEEMTRQIGMIAGEFPKIKTLLLLFAYDERLIIEGLLEGVDGILLNDAETHTEHLLRSIHDLHRDGHVLSGKVAKIAMQQIASRNKKEQLRFNLQQLRISVSARELDILFFLMQGYTNQEMAFLLNVKEKSAREYISNVYKKIGINERGRAIAFLKDVSDTSGMAD